MHHLPRSAHLGDLLLVLENDPHGPKSATPPPAGARYLVNAAAPSVGPRWRSVGSAPGGGAGRRCQVPGAAAPDVLPGGACSRSPEVPGTWWWSEGGRRVRFLTGG